MDGRTLAVFVACSIVSGISAQGLVQIGGDDLVSLGSWDASSQTTLKGWKYIRLSLCRLVSSSSLPGNDGKIALLGAAISETNAGGAYHYAALESHLEVNYYEGTAALNGFFDNLGDSNRPALIVIPTALGGELDADEISILNANAVKLQMHVYSGGSLLTHLPDITAEGWLKALLPNIQADSCSGYSKLTSSGKTVLPRLMHSDINSCSQTYTRFGNFQTMAVDQYSRTFIMSGIGQVPWGKWTQLPNSLTSISVNFRSVWGVNAGSIWSMEIIDKPDEHWTSHAAINGGWQGVQAGPQGAVWAYSPTKIYQRVGIVHENQYDGTSFTEEASVTLSDPKDIALDMQQMVILDGSDIRIFTLNSDGTFNREETPIVNTKNFIKVDTMDAHIWGLDQEGSLWGAYSGSDWVHINHFPRATDIALNDINIMVATPEGIYTQLHHNGQIQNVGWVLQSQQTTKRSDAELIQIDADRFHVFGKKWNTKIYYADLPGSCQVPSSSHSSSNCKNLPMVYEDAKCVFTCHTSFVFPDATTEKTITCQNSGQFDTSPGDCIAA